MTAFDRAWDLMKNDFDDYLDDFLPGPNINPHFDPDYPPEHDNQKCMASEDCPDPARTGPFHYSGGYIGKVTACKACWQGILDHLEEEQAIEDSDDDRPTWDD